MEFLFLYPRFLLLLVLVPFFVFVYFFSLVYNKKKAVLFGNFAAMERFFDIEFFSKNFMALYFNLGVLILLILALAGTSVSFDASSSSFDYVIAVDVSESMGATDILPNRLDAAIESAKDFVDFLPVGVEVGVIGFAGDAVVYQELDSSKMKVKMAIDELSFGEVSGTNVYNALLSANKLFGTKQMKSVIFISDGQLNVGDAPTVIRYINRNNLVVNTIAIGTEEGGVTGRDIVSGVDLNFLKSLAFNSGGQFFRVEDANGIRESFDSLVKETNRKVTLDLSFYFLLVAIGLFSVLWVLYNLRFKTVP
ncbi:MAG: VWA domain-containing protein [Nanoarchaeota archaeon]|nr:VWA domain-containing protein [Nanoarchaeota archaeon]